MHYFQLYFGKELNMFRPDLLSILPTTCFTIYLQCTYIYTSNCTHLFKIQCDIYILLCVQYWTLDDGQRNCPKHVAFYSKNKFEELVHLFGFIIRRRFALLSVCWVSNEYS